MMLLTRKKTPAEQLKQAAIEAAVTALGDLQDRSKGKPALSGVRAVGTGAVLFTAARAAFKGRRFLREQLFSNEAEGEETTTAREERAEHEADKYQGAYTMQADEQAEASEEKEHRPDAAEQDEPEASDEVEAVEHAEASDKGEDECDQDHDAPDDGTGDGEPEASGGGPSDDADEGPGAHEGSAEAEPRGREVHDARDPDTESGLKPARPLPDRKPVRRAARKKGLQPSLELPQQRWPRLSASKR